MNPFLKTYRLALTPLSPIHIGCGEDFEPTNYVIDDGILYGFDPSRAVLSDLQKSKLMDAANRASLQAIQRFFKDNAQTFKAQADVLIPVSSGVAQAYEQRIGRAANIEASGNSVFNQLFIERTSYTGTARLPYMPGSSLKGAIRTAIVDDLNRGQPAQYDERDRRGAVKSDMVERRLLKGDFASSPLRLLKISDLMPANGHEPARRVLYGVNRKKRQVIKDGQELQPKGIAARKECILHGQYRAFVADAVLPQLQAHHTGKDTPAPELRPTDLRRIASQSNTYNQTRLQRELAVLDGRGLVNPAWKQSLEKLLAGDLGAQLRAGDAFLIRLGRYGGAESKTLSGEGVAQIKIMGARVDGKQQSTMEGTTKTVWLAAETESDQKHLLPFGWAVVEIDPQGDLPPLQAWCAAESKGRPDMAGLRQKFEAEKAAAATRRLEIQAETAAREAAKRAEQEATVQRAQALASMSPHGQLTETLRQKCEELDARITGGNFKKQTPDAGKAGLYQEATRLVKTALELDDWSASDKLTLVEMLESWLPKVVGPWDAKEQRKKLKFAALRGTL